MSGVHNFYPNSSKMPKNCKCCKKLAWPKNSIRCQHCRIIVHKSCLFSVPDKCKATVTSPSRIDWAAIAPSPQRKYYDESPLASRPSSVFRAALPGATGDLHTPLPAIAAAIADQHREQDRSLGTKKRRKRSITVPATSDRAKRTPSRPPAPTSPFRPLSSNRDSLIKSEGAAHSPREENRLAGLCLGEQRNVALQPQVAMSGPFYLPSSPRSSALAAAGHRMSASSDKADALVMQMPVLQQQPLAMQMPVLCVTPGYMQQATVAVSPQPSATKPVQNASPSMMSLTAAVDDLMSSTEPESADTLSVTKTEVKLLETPAAETQPAHVPATKCQSEGVATSKEHECDFFDELEDLPSVAEATDMSLPGLPAPKPAQRDVRSASVPSVMPLEPLKMEVVLEPIARCKSPRASILSANFWTPPAAH